MSNSRGRSPFRLMLVGVMAVVLILPIAPRIKTIWDLNHRLEQLENQKAELQSVNRDLEQELQQAGSMATVEKIAREQLGMVKPGETRIIEVLP
ncbi:FtsB family cell division protein [Syntrophomonas curvata]